MSTSPKTARSVWSGLLALCAAGVVWGTIGPAVDVVHDRSSLSVLAIGAYRAAAAVAVLVLAAAVSGRRAACLALMKEHGPRVASTGVLTAIFQLLFFVAVVITGVSVTTVVALGSAPVLLLVIASVRQRQPPGRSQTLTVGTVLLGLVLVSSTGPGALGTAHPGWGLLAALGSGAAYALAAEAGGPLTHTYDALSVTTCTTSVLAIVLVTGGLATTLLRGQPVLSTDSVSWILMAYLGIVTLAFAYVLFYDGLSSTPSGTAVVATLAEPVTAVLIAALFLGETLSRAAVLGCLLILGAIGSLGRRAERPPAQ
jgi:DME family drug/metabolite transporter